MTIESEAVTVTAVPTALNTAEGQGSDRASITVRNDSGSTVWLGGSDVTTSTGMVATPLLGLLGGTGDDGNPATGVGILTLVAQTIDPVTFDHPTEFVFEFSRFVDAGVDGGPILAAVPDGTVAFVTVFGIPA